MKPKLKPDYDPESIQADLIDMVCNEYRPGVSVRFLAKEMGLSPMKTRKILITGGVYATDISTEVGELYKDGKRPTEIAEIFNMTVANVNSYLPYERIIYNMEERSVEADRQQRYRDRKKGLLPPVEEKKELPKIERVRNKTMIIVVGKKLRKLLPTEVFDSSSDPLARESSITYLRDGEWVEPADPDKNIWCAEVTAAGRGKGKKQGVVLESANSGFAVMAKLPPAPLLTKYEEDMDWTRRREAEKENKEKIREYRKRLEEEWIGAIRDGLLHFALPEERVLDYTDTVGRIELLKGRRSTPGVRLEELIERELKWENDDDPLERFNVRGNWTNRKFGNSGSYRQVDEAVHQMLGLTQEEREAWLGAFLAPMREKLAGE